MANVALLYVVFSCCYHRLFLQFPTAVHLIVSECSKFSLFGHWKKVCLNNVLMFWLLCIRNIFVKVWIVYTIIKIGLEIITAIVCTYSEAVKMWVELVQMALMGLSWPLISPSGEKLSTVQSLRMPPLQPLSRDIRPGTIPKADTQSLWAFGTC